MKIVVLGSGAMGSLFGGYLSKHNDVWMVDIDQNKVNVINEKGVKVTEPEGIKTFYPKAVTDTSELPKMDLIIIFVKAMFSESALSSNFHLIGENTYLMTLQNGVGHEAVLSKFTDKKNVVIGSTQHNSSLIAPGEIHHGGGGITSIGLLEGNSKELSGIAGIFSKCGFKTITSQNVQQQIWSKLMLNTSVSSLTAVLQVKLGFILEDKYAWTIAQRLAKEAVDVANASGLNFDFDEVIGEIEKVLEGAKEGYTSIYADIKNGAKSEVDTISGSVVKEGKRLGIPVPAHEVIVGLIHSLENKNININS